MEVGVGWRGGDVCGDGEDCGGGGEGEGIGVEVGRGVGYDEADAWLCRN